MEVKRQALEADYSLPYSAEVKIVEAVAPFPHKFSRHGA
jgi:hypothetical protein